MHIRNKARFISEFVRREMTAEALMLAYDTSTPLGKRAVINAIAATMDSIGNPLDRVWIEDATGKRCTYKVEQAQAVLGDPATFRYLWAIPQSERRNSKARWLTAATIDNVAANGATLFFALPRGMAREFGPHVTLLRSLAQADIVPQYGFGYAREYGNPDYFALGYVNKSGLRAIDEPDWDGSSPGEHPGRYARRAILDVFPMNVLSDVHLQQRLAGESFKQWIFRHTGPESLQQFGPRCFAWFVPASQTVSLSARLKVFGMTLREHPEARALPVSPVRGSIRYRI
jgi:hypothetical protein